RRRRRRRPVRRRRTPEQPCPYCVRHFRHRHCPCPVRSAGDPVREVAPAQPLTAVSSFGVCVSVVVAVISPLPRSTRCSSLLAGSLTYAASPSTKSVGRGLCQSVGSRHSSITAIRSVTRPLAGAITCSLPSVPRTIASPCGPRASERKL